MVRPIEAQVRITGLNELGKRLKALPKELSGKRGGPLRKGLFMAAKVIRDDARRRAPRGNDTPLPGRLKKNIIALRDRNPERKGKNEIYTIFWRGNATRRERQRVSRSAARIRREVIAAGGTARQAVMSSRRNPKDAFYGFFVENGTAKMKARPFLRPAFDANKRKSVQVFSAELDKAILKLERQNKI